MQFVTFQKLSLGPYFLILPATICAPAYELRTKSSAAIEY